MTGNQEEHLAISLVRRAPGAPWSVLLEVVVEDGHGRVVLSSDEAGTLGVALIAAAAEAVGENREQAANN